MAKPSDEEATNTSTNQSLAMVLPAVGPEAKVLDLGDFGEPGHGRLLGALFLGDLHLLVVDVVVNVQHHVAAEAVAYFFSRLAKR